MLIELECVLAQVLPESGDCGPPFTLQEVSDIAAKYSDDCVSYSRVHRAWAALYENPNTRDVVAPLDAESRAIALSARGARRVLRRVWHSRVPAKIKNRNPYQPAERIERIEGGKRAANSLLHVE